MNLLLTCFLYGHSLEKGNKNCIRCSKPIKKHELEQKKELNKLIEEQRRKVWKK